MANSSVKNEAEDNMAVLCDTSCFILLCFIWQPWPMNLVFAFCEDLSAVEVLVLCSLQTICLEFFPPASHSLFSLNLSLSKNIGDKETRSLTLSLWAFASIFYWHYEHSWLNCKCTPWLVLLQYVINVFFSQFSHILSVFCAFSGDRRLDESYFVPVSKPKVFYL